MTIWPEEAQRSSHLIEESQTPEAKRALIRLVKDNSLPSDGQRRVAISGVLFETLGPGDASLLLDEIREGLSGHQAYLIGRAVKRFANHKAMQ